MIRTHEGPSRVEGQRGHSTGLSADNATLHQPFACVKLNRTKLNSRLHRGILTNQVIFGDLADWIHRCEPDAALDRTAALHARFGNPGRTTADCRTNPGESVPRGVKRTPTALDEGRWATPAADGGRAAGAPCARLCRALQLTWPAPINATRIQQVARPTRPDATGAEPLIRNPADHPQREGGCPLVRDSTLNATQS